MNILGDGLRSAEDIMGNMPESVANDLVTAEAVIIEEYSMLSAYLICKVINYIALYFSLHIYAIKVFNIS